MKLLSYLFTAFILSACSTAAVSNPIVIQSQGESFFPVQTEQQIRSTQSRQSNTSAQALKLYKGQPMQAANSYLKGNLTGGILVKTTDQESVLLIPAQQAAAMGEEFVILSFDENTDLYAKLNEIKKRSDVITAEIEVNTKRRKPR